MEVGRGGEKLMMAAPELQVGPSVGLASRDILEDFRERTSAGRFTKVSKELSRL
jgi:hypothetical protein